MSNTPPPISCHVFISTSLDGFIARTDGALDWLMKHNIDGEDHGFDELIDTVDGIIMGRRSYEIISEFAHWPYSKPTIVMSRSLTQSDVPGDLQNKVHVSDLPPEYLAQTLALKGWKSAYVDGGRLIQSFLAAGLIDDMTLTQIPILLGEGLRLFGSSPRDIDLELIKTAAFPSGLINTTYRIKK